MVRRLNNYQLVRRLSARESLYAFALIRKRVPELVEANLVVPELSKAALIR
jgi:hypothetical protein